MSSSLSWLSIVRIGLGSYSELTKNVPSYMWEIEPQLKDVVIVFNNVSVLSADADRMAMDFLLNRNNILYIINKMWK